MDDFFKRWANSIWGAKSIYGMCIPYIESDVKLTEDIYKAIYNERKRSKNMENKIIITVEDLDNAIHISCHLDGENESKSINFPKYKTKKERHLKYVLPGGHVEDLGKLGTPTRYHDSLGRQLYVGDIIELYDDFGNVWKFNAKDSPKRFVAMEDGKPYIFGIKRDCDPETGIICNGWHLLKCTSHADVKNDYCETDSTIYACEVEVEEEVNDD